MMASKWSSSSFQARKERVNSTMTSRDSSWLNIPFHLKSYLLIRSRGAKTSDLLFQKYWFRWMRS
jgi:lipopolysaccharide biosynthesis protein